jgi:archaemetzincin
METIRRLIEENLGSEVQREPALRDPVYAWDPNRRQYGSSLILRELLPIVPRGVEKIFAVTEKDLYIPMLSFIFGQAQLGGVAAIVSLARLRQEFYGLPPNAALLAERARKEALHELGHTYGLVHCVEVDCAMSLSTNVRQLDLKGNGFCADCRATIAEKRR